MSKQKKQYSEEEAKKVVREKLTGLKASEATIASWEDNIVKNPDRDYLVARLESGKSEFERKHDGSYTILIETGFGGPMFDNMKPADRDALLKDMKKLF